MKHLTISLTLAALLVGCADQPQKDAVIEDRDITAAAKVEDSKATIPADGTARVPNQEVETRPLAEASTEMKPLDGSQPGGAAGAGFAALSERIIYFDFDSSAIRDEYRGLLEAHAEFLKSNPSSKVILQGHADERGTREYNLALGQRRSESVLRALSLLGVPESQMEAVSMGEEKPVAMGHNEEAWRQNRRTEILYRGE